MIRRMLAALALSVFAFLALPTALASPTAAAAAPSAPVQSCKQGGWQTLADASGAPFKNQGQCVAYQIHHPVGLDDLVNSSSTGSILLGPDPSLCPAPPPPVASSITSVQLDATYPGSASVGTVHLEIIGCWSRIPPGQLKFGAFVGTFTMTTNVGTVTGTASGPVTATVAFPSILFQLTLTIETGTGSYAGTTGTLQCTAHYPDNTFVVTS